MEISWIGHAAFRIRSGTSTLITDPFAEDLGLRIPPNIAQASVVTSSNPSRDHSAIAAISGSPTVLKGPGEYELDRLRIHGIRTALGGAHTPNLPPWNTIFVLEAEDLTVCHLGSQLAKLASRHLDELGNPHVLLVPVGDFGCFSPAAAAEMVTALQPRFVIPMMYAQPGNRHPLASVGSFLQELGTAAPEPQDRVALTPASLPADGQIRVALPRPLAMLL